MNDYDVDCPRIVPGQVDLPPLVSGDQITATTAAVTWEPPTDPNGIIIGYRVTYIVVATLPDNKSECVKGAPERNVSVDGDSTEVMLTDLSKLMYSEQYRIYSGKLSRISRIVKVFFANIACTRNPYPVYSVNPRKFSPRNLHTCCFCERFLP